MRVAEYSVHLQISSPNLDFLSQKYTTFVPSSRVGQWLSRMVDKCVHLLRAVDVVDFVPGPQKTLD